MAYTNIRGIKEQMEKGCPHNCVCQYNFRLLFHFFDSPHDSNLKIIFLNFNEYNDNFVPRGLDRSALTSPHIVRSVYSSPFRHKLDKRNDSAGRDCGGASAPLMKPNTDYHHAPEFPCGLIDCNGRRKNPTKMQGTNSTHFFGLRRVGGFCA